MKLRKISDYLTQKVRCVVYGKPGVKKTRFACTFPKPALIDFDNGFRSVQDLLPPGYPTYAIESWEDMLFISSMLRTNKEGYESVVIDTFTRAERSIMTSCLKQTGNDYPGFKEWGLAAEKTRKFMDWICALDMNVVFVCQELLIKDDKSGDVTIGPNLPGKMMLESAAMVDEVWHMRDDIPDPANKGKWLSRLLTQKDGAYIAKDRSGKLDKFEIPDWPTIYKKMVLNNIKHEEKK